MAFPVSLTALLAVVFSGCALAESASEKLPVEFLVYENTMPSMARLDPETGEMKGLYADLMNGASAYTGIPVTLRFEGRQRAEQAVYDGTSDAVLMHPTWAKQGDKLLFSDAVFEHREYLYSVVEIDQDKSLETQIDGAVICVHQGYQYPSLKPYFVTRKALASEVSSHVELLTLLVNGRCDFAVMSFFRAKWAADRLSVDQPLYRTVKPITESTLGIAVRRARADFLVGFNAYIAEIKRTGEWARMQMNHFE